MFKKKKSDYIADDEPKELSNLTKLLLIIIFSVGMFFLTYTCISKVMQKDIDREMQNIEIYETNLSH